MVKIIKEIEGLDGRKRVMIIDSDQNVILYSGIASDFRKNPEVKKAILDFDL